MKNAILAARILLGAIFVVFGLNYWLKFIPGPPPPGGLAGQFIGAIYASGFLAVVKVLEVAGGALVLSGRYTPLGLLLLGPVIVVILLYDLKLAGAFNPVSAAAGVLSVFLLWAYRRAFAGIVRPQN